MANKLQIAPVNANNLLRWYPNTTPSVDNSTFVTGIHNGYLYKWRTFSDYLPILTEDTLTLYTNFDTDTYLEGNQIKVVEESSCGSYTVINDALQYDITGTAWGLRNAKITLTVPTTNIKTNHNFRLAIVGEGTAEEYSFSDKLSNTSGIRKVVKLSTGNFILVGSGFEYFTGINNVAVIDTAGNQVAGYSFGTGFNNDVNDVVELADGSLIFVGNFTSYNGTSINRIIKTSSTGVYDATFNVGTGADGLVSFVVKDSTGNVYVGSPSSFFYNGSGTAQNIYKLSSVGVRDAGYVPSSITPRDVKVTSDDKLVVALSGPSNGVRRLNTDSTTDGTFSSGLGIGATVDTLAIDGTGKIYVGGSFGFPSAPINLARLNSDGSLDGTFSPTITGDVKTISLDGANVIVGGTSLGAVLNTSGTTLEEFTVTSTINILLAYGTGYLVGSLGTVTINGTTRSFGELEQVVTENVLYVSNYFTLFSRTAKNINNTHLISFYNKSNVYNYEWSDFDETVDDFYQVRLASSMIEISYPSEKEIYQEATTGRPRVTRATNNKQITFEVYFNTEELHDGLSTVSNFRYFGVNGRKYIVESYEPSVAPNFNLFKASMTLKDVEFDRRINICTT